MRWTLITHMASTYKAIWGSTISIMIWKFFIASLPKKFYSCYVPSNHKQYILKVQRGPLPQNTWTVSKRYSDFDALDALLKAAGLNLPLPPKKVFGKMDRDFIAERQQGLQVAQSLLSLRFTMILTCHPLCSPELPECPTQQHTTRFS